MGGDIESYSSFFILYRFFSPRFYAIMNDKSLRNKLLKTLHKEKIIKFNKKIHKVMKNIKVRQG